MAREMKDSGIEWIGEIPANWSVKKVKHGFYRSKEEAHQEEPVVLTLARDGVKVRDISNNEGQIAESYYNYNPVLPGDLLINPMDLYSGANCSVSKVSGVISPAYINLRYKKGYIPHYYDYYFKTQYWAMTMFAHGKGVSFDNRWILGVQELKNYFIPVPYEEEQKNIAMFLDNKCVEIDNILIKTRASIAEYKKLKQAIITQAVAKGVRGEREIRDSGIEWIGEIPKEWSCTQLGRFITIESGISVGKSYPKDTELVEVPYLRVANVQGDYVDISDIATLFVTPDEAEKYSLHAGQLLMTEGGDRDKLGRGCLWNGEIDPCIHQNHIFAVETNELLDIKYLDYITTSDIARVYFDITAKKTTNLACTNKSTILRFVIPVPSKIEQIEIREYLDAECPKIDSIIEKKEKYLIELDNYRKSLIYEYVTGKKEVPQGY